MKFTKYFLFVNIIILSNFIIFNKLIAESNYIGINSSFNWENEIGVTYSYLLNENYMLGLNASFSDFDSGIATFTHLPLSLHCSYYFSDITEYKLLTPFLKIGAGYSLVNDKPKNKKNQYYVPLYESNPFLLGNIGLAYRYNDFLYSFEIVNKFKFTNHKLQEKHNINVQLSINYSL